MLVQVLVLTSSQELFQSVQTERCKALACSYQGSLK